MAEAVMGFAVQLMVGKLIATAGEEIRLIRGLKKEVAKLKESLEMVNAFLHHASRRQVTDEPVKLWLENLEDLAYKADDILDDINYEALRRKVEIRNQMKRKVRIFFSLRNPLVFRLTMAHRIKDLNLKLKEVKSDARDLQLKEIFENSATSLLPDTETNSVTVDSIFIGREDDMSNIVEMLVQRNDEVLSVIPITGMGGLGKTTLARKIFKDPQIVRRFNQRIWVCVAENFDSKTIFKEMLGPSDAQVESDEALVHKLQEKLKEGNYLLVLDDLWNNAISKWEDFRNSLLGLNSNKGNFCLVTTRSTEVASIVKTKDHHCPLNELSSHDCWLIIKDKAFADKEVPEDLEGVGEEVASKCCGVPLAANVVGATLKGKGIDDWKSFLEAGFSDLKEGENKVIQVLKVSFDRLPSALLKKCFAYLSLFPKDAELEKEWLIQLWMAEGFLGGNDDMESIGNRVYDLLLQNCFLQEPQKDKYGNIMTSKMHDLVHDLACLVSEVESFNVKNCKTDKRYPPRLRYLATESLDEEAYKLMQGREVYLRTLFLGGNTLSDRVFRDIKNLHALVLHESFIRELPNSIGKLTKLRLLDVSSYNIKSFPEDICELFNMQTLRAVGCKLDRLPDRLHQLVNMRHLVVDRHEDRQMPLQLGKLTSLRTLKFFNVGHENGSIEELGSLNNLTGELGLFHLERVNNKGEATRASLVGKLNIYKLEYVWIHSEEINSSDEEINSSDSGSSTCKNNDEEVLEGLEPHPNIKSLTIKGFKGDQFPPWAMSMSVVTKNLDKLIEVRLIDCGRCEEVPTLGNLPLLEILVLDGLKKVTSLGHSFYYPNGTIESMSRGCTRRQTPPFRSLRSFTLRNMDNLLKWIEAPRTTSADESGADHAFHSLEELEIWECFNIEIVPNHKFPALQKLTILGVKIGTWLVEKISDSNASSFTTLEIFCVPGVTRVSCNGHLIENLRLEACPDLQLIQFSNEGGLTSSSLKSFEVDGCKALTDVMLGDDLVYPSLERFEMHYCRNVSFSNLKNFERMPRLHRLDIIGCPGLRRLRAFGTNSLSHLTELKLGTNNFNSQGIHELQSLRDLTLYGESDWDTLPHHLQHLSSTTTLNSLNLNNFGGVEVLPEWLGNLSSLEELSITNFKSLKELPSKEAMERLTKLNYLYFYNCPLLSEINNPQSHLYHSEWSKISHISIVSIS